MSSGETREQNALSGIKPSRIFIPILIGLGVVGYMIWKEVDYEVFSHFKFGLKAIIMLLVAAFFMVFRDFGYMMRLRILANKELSWHQVFKVIMLWEFTSAITPSAVGGTSVAVIYVHKEGLSVGKSSTIVMLTSFFDELFFIVMFPLVYITIGNTLFDIAGITDSAIAKSLWVIAITGYSLKLAFLILVSYGLFINPEGVKKLIFNIFKLPFLRRWKRGAVRTGIDIMMSAEQIKHRNFKFWISTLFATFISWSSRYLVVNAIILAFFNFTDHFLLFARQLVMWIMMLVMPTPGGSGFSEYLFKEYLGEFIPVDLAIQGGAAAMLALIWRLTTYYPYLIIGAVMLPRWIKEKFGTDYNKNKEE